MLLIFLTFALLNFHQVVSENKAAPGPLFEFWSPLTWISPKFSSETMYHILRATRESSEKTYQQFKKALLPANLFFRNIRVQRQAWDDGPKKHQKSKGSRRPNGKKTE